MKRAFRLPVGNRARHMAVALVVAVFVGLILLLAADVRRQLERLATASSDNVHFMLSQTEIEAMALKIEIAMALHDPAIGLEPLRLRYNVLYSRIDTVSGSPTYRDLRSDPAVKAHLVELRDFLDDTVAWIDGPDDGLASALPELAARTDAARQSIRKITLRGIEIFSDVGHQQRTSVAATLLNIAALTVTLIVTLLLMVWLLLRLVRRSEASATEIRLARDRMQTVLSTSQDAVMVTDARGVVLDYNGAATRIFGYARSTALGARLSDLILPRDARADFLEELNRHHDTGTGRIVGKGTVRIVAKRLNGESFPAELSLATAQTPQGKVFIAFVRDIADRVRAEQDLRDARDRAIAGEKSKADLLAVMSHEMRTPLNGMLGTLELFDENALDSTHRNYVEIIRRSGRQLLTQVNDVLDITRLDARKMTLKVERFDLRTLVGALLETQAQAARANGNVLHLECPDSFDGTMVSDPGRLEQVLFNLVGNAIKFTTDGAITVILSEGRGADRISIAIRDTGTGIAAADLERIFGDFVTIDASYSRRTEGAGLGLGIARRLVRALGGTLTAESTPGEGSTFTLDLPREIRTRSKIARARPPAPLPVLPPLNVLMVEDNATNRLIARKLLEREGHKVAEAHDGCAGVTAAAERRYDVILMDISMPGMDGIEAARSIRAGPGPNARTPIIATTAHALPDEQKAFRDAGMDDVVNKPISKAALHAAIHRAVHAESLQ